MYMKIDANRKQQSNRGGLVQDLYGAYQSGRIARGQADLSDLVIHRARSLIQRKSGALLAFTET